MLRRVTPASEANVPMVLCSGMELRITGNGVNGVTKGEVLLVMGLFVVGWW